MGLTTIKHDGTKRRREADLDAERIGLILAVIGTFQEKPTWEAVIQRVGAEYGWTYTRQTLSGHDRIKLAMQNRRHGRRADAGGSPLSARARAREQDRSKLLEELRIARALIERLTARFLIWSFNAYQHGLLEADLDYPITSIDRSAPPTKLRKVGS